MCVPERGVSRIRSLRLRHVSRDRGQSGARHGDERADARGREGLGAPGGFGGGFREHPDEPRAIFALVSALDARGDAGALLGGQAHGIGGVGPQKRAHAMQRPVELAEIERPRKPLAQPRGREVEIATPSRSSAARARPDLRDRSPRARGLGRVFEADIADEGGRSDPPRRHGSAAGPDAAWSCGAAAAAGFGALARATSAALAWARTCSASARACSAALAWARTCPASARACSASARACSASALARRAIGERAVRLDARLVRHERLGGAGRLATSASAWASASPCAAGVAACPVGLRACFVRGALGPDRDERVDASLSAAELARRASARDLSASARAFRSRSWLCAPRRGPPPRRRAWSASARAFSALARSLSASARAFAAAPRSSRACASSFSAWTRAASARAS